MRINRASGRQPRRHRRRDGSRPGGQRLKALETAGFWSQKSIEAQQSLEKFDPTQPLALNLPLLRDGDDTGGSRCALMAWPGPMPGQSFVGASVLRRLNGGTAKLAGSLVLSVPWGNVTAAIPAAATY